MPTNSKEQVRRVFGGRATEWAACYRDPEAEALETQNLLSRQRIALRMVRAMVPPPAKVLDLGCGTGETAEKLMGSGYEVWGLDIAEPMVCRARERCGSDRFRVGDMEHIPFEDDMFDAVVCLGVIEYLDKDERALREIWRVLKPGGRAVISTPSAISPLHHMDSVVLGLTAAARPLYYLVKYRLRGRPAPGDPPSPELAPRLYHRGRWLRRLRSAGLEAEDWICHGWGWYRSRLGYLAELLSRKGKLVRRHLEGLFGPESLGRAIDAFFRSRALNWLPAEQLVQVRAVK